MNSARLANNWSSYDSDGMCWWEATFPFELGPSFLPRWQEVVLKTAEATDIFRVDAITEIGYARERDGDLTDYLRSHPDEVPGTDEWLPGRFVLEQLTTLPTDAAATRLDFIDNAGEIATAWVHSIDELTSRLGFRRSSAHRPMTIVHTISEMDPPTPSTVETSFLLSTDIWLPWTTAWSHADSSAATDAVLDNRVLAAANGGRLNSFLRLVREEALTLGGTWRVSPGTPLIESQVNEYGVILDAAPPPTH
jgi:hypothetical protein